MEVNLVAEGFKFMLLGMGIVFLFLYVMVLVLKLQATIVDKYFPQKEEVKTPTKSNNKKLIAAISAAVQHHKNSKD
jgi:oxaloacetate decarboxylase gamma subunit